MEPDTVLRLLPWSSPEGKPCFLVPGGGSGPLSRLADDMEAVRLAMAAEMIRLARKVQDDPLSPYVEVRYAGVRLAECLNDVLRVAESRGMRLPAPNAEDADHADEDEEAEGAGRTGHRGPGGRS